MIKKLISLPGFLPVLLSVSMLSGCGRGGLDTFSATETTSPKAIFDQACASCHGNDGSGQFWLLFKLEPAGKKPQELADTIYSGREGMPSFPMLTESQRLALADYILKLRK